MIRSCVIVAALAGCASSTAPDPGLEHLAVTKLAPQTIIPGTTVIVTGESFVDEPWGSTTVHLRGDAGGQAIDAVWPATFVDFNALKVDITGGMLDELGGDVEFHGTAAVEVVAQSDSAIYASDELDVTLTFRDTLAPAPSKVATTGVIFVNDAIEIDGDGFLLGGNEGTTIARVTGCFEPDTGGSGSCTEVQSIDLTMQPTEALSRTKASFPFSPKIAGIKPGAFSGMVTVVNQQTARPESAAEGLLVDYTLVTSQIFSLDPGTASLGQYVFVKGGGFVGGEPGALTEVELSGTFTKTGGSAVPVTMTVIPEFADGRLVRYILNTDDALGHALDLRKDTGQFTGTATPVISWGSDTVRGVASNASFGIAPIRQVVYLHYETSYVEGLRDFGLRAVDSKIREEILAVCRDTYKGVNIDFRDAPPTDFALFENVELVGVDPNNMGLFGYDNSPGKDSGNVRLYDQLGGVNASTQEDGSPGYGGVFLRSLMGFSQHPGAFTQKVEGADVVFDQIFDPFRADQGGQPITSSDLSNGIASIDPAQCPGGDRQTQIACAVHVMGNLVGGTLAHEIGHSLGLANPYQDGLYHDQGDGPNRLMDAGGDRPFLERAVLQGQGPGVFCTDEYAYLRQVLPSTDPANDIARPSCD